MILVKRICNLRYIWESGDPAAGTAQPRGGRCDALVHSVYRVAHCHSQGSTAYHWRSSSTIGTVSIVLSRAHPRPPAGSGYYGFR